MSRVFLTTTGTGTWTVPAGITSVVFECIGGGAGGANGVSGTAYPSGGGGGGYSSSGSISVIPGTVCNYNVGAGGAVGSSNVAGDSWIALNNTATLITSSGVVSGAKGGTTGVAAIPPTTGLGGQASSGIGAIKYSGGNAVGGVNDIPAGGGAAGPLGNGGNGNNNGGGGGGNGGGSAGGAANGGNNFSGTGGGTTGHPAGTNGGGGFGGQGATNAGGGGGNGTEWDALHGSGGGAGGFSSSGGGLYGAGSNAAGFTVSTGPAVVGAQGIIVITYNNINLSIGFFQLMNR